MIAAKRAGVKNMINNRRMRKGGKFKFDSQIRS